MRSYMTSSGSPYSRFRRALASGNLALVRAAAAELPAVDLADALAICLLMGSRDDERYERAAERWLARLALERPGVGLEELRLGLSAFEAPPDNPVDPRARDDPLCERLGLAGAGAARDRAGGAAPGAARVRGAAVHPRGRAREAGRAVRAAGVGGRGADAAWLTAAPCGDWTNL